MAISNVGFVCMVLTFWMERMVHGFRFFFKSSVVLGSLTISKKVSMQVTAFYPGQCRFTWLVCNNLQI